MHTCSICVLFPKVLLYFFKCFFVMNKLVALIKLVFLMYIMYIGFSLNWSFVSTTKIVCPFFYAMNKIIMSLLSVYSI